MEINRFVTVAIGVFVAAIVILSIAAPVIHAGTAETLTYTNEGTPYAEYDGEQHIIKLSYDGTDLTITADGVECQNPDFSLYGSATIVYGSDGLIRLSSNGNVRGFADNLYRLNMTSGVDVTITIGATTTVVSDGTTTLNVPLTPLAYIAPTGDYVLSVSPCVTDDSIIIAGTTDYSGGYFASTLANGPIDDLTVANAYCWFGEGVTVSNVEAVVNSSAVSGNLVKIDNVEFTTEASNSNEYTAVYSYFLAPAVVEYNNPNFIDSTVTTIAGMLPVLMLVGVMLFVVGTYVTNRRT